MSVFTLQKKAHFKSKKLRDSAKNQECTIRLSECNYDHTTTVLAHLGGGGMGMKKSDLFAAFTCSSCHDILDGRINKNYEKCFLELQHRIGIEKTQQIWADNKLIKVG